MCCARFIVMVEVWSPTFRLSGLGTSFCRDAGRLRIRVRVKNTTRSPGWEAAVTAASSSTERLRLFSPSRRALLRGTGGGGESLSSAGEAKVLNTRFKMSVMLETETQHVLNHYISDHEGFTQLPRCCLHVARWCSACCGPGGKV